jgi:Zn finger protein HypA/HybF involved in hydrogenase expression
VPLLGEKNPFLAVTVEELDNNIAKATKVLGGMNSLHKWREQKHCCITCGEKLPKEETKFVSCEKCRQKARQYYKTTSTN